MMRVNNLFSPCKMDQSWFCSRNLSKENFHILVPKLLATLERQRVKSHSIYTFISCVYIHTQERV